MDLDILDISDVYIPYVSAINVVFATYFMYLLAPEFIPVCATYIYRILVTGYKPDICTPGTAPSLASVINHGA